MAVDIEMLNKVNFFSKEDDLTKEIKKHFVGEVKLYNASKHLDSKELKTFFVTFFDGARTGLHYHDTEQILIAHEGVGRVTVMNGIGESNDEKIVVKEQIVKVISNGQCVLIPPGKIHWHGADENEKKFSHIAILKAGGSTVWI